MLHSALRNTVLFVLCSLTVSACASSVRFSSEHESPRASTRAGGTSGAATQSVLRDNGEQEHSGMSFQGKASYYADKFQGRQTASGETFDQSALTAAHRTLPFGTMVKVRNLVNNATVIVRINDRGPFVEGRVIDLSRAAAEQLGMIREGIIPVEITVL